MPSELNPAKNALLLLDNGVIFYGYGFGAKTESVGEICFNTSMTGYQEILTDPSYAEQIINLVGCDGLRDLVADYQWMCDMLLEEEMHFHLTKNYRLSTFKEAVEQVYSNVQYRESYLNGCFFRTNGQKFHGSGPQYEVGVHGG